MTSVYPSLRKEAVLGELQDSPPRLAQDSLLCSRQTPTLGLSVPDVIRCSPVWGLQAIYLMMGFLSSHRAWQSRWSAQECQGRFTFIFLLPEVQYAPSHLGMEMLFSWQECIYWSCHSFQATPSQLSSRPDRATRLPVIYWLIDPNHCADLAGGTS